jgi:acetyl-CoA acetyltransferase
MSSRSSRRAPVIVGVGLSDLPIADHLDGVQHHALAAQRALRDAGIEKGTIDGYASAGGSGGEGIDDAVTMAEYLRIDHRFLDGTMTGGSSFQFHVQHAAQAIREGTCDTMLITYGSDQFSRRGRRVGSGTSAARPVVGPLQYEAPFGLTIVAAYAMAARRHMHEFGTTPEDLAEIAVGIREFATMNADAIYRDPITIDDVLNSRVIADPLHVLDCCSVTDGGGALILTTAERARDLDVMPVHVLGAASAQTHWNIGQMPLFTTTAATQSRQALDLAGVTTDDVDTIQLYDSFTITVLLLLEDLGFCGKGEGGSYVREGHLRKGGRTPLNTDGGGLSAYHPGMRGIFLLAEACRQLRGLAGEAQVPDCKIAVASGCGGHLSCSGTVVLGTEAPS